MTGFRPGDGLPGGEETTGTGRVRLEAELPALWVPVAGPIEGAEFALIDRPGQDSSRHASLGPVTLVLDRVDVTLPRTIGDISSPIAGRFAARLCRAAGPDAAPDLGDCFDMSGRFETEAAISLPFPWYAN